MMKIDFGYVGCGWNAVMQNRNWSLLCRIGIVICCEMIVHEIGLNEVLVGIVDLIDIDLLCIRMMGYLFVVLLLM